jgi:hypothetical protein
MTEFGAFEPTIRSPFVVAGYQRATGLGGSLADRDRIDDPEHFRPPCGLLWRVPMVQHRLHRLAQHPGAAPPGAAPGFRDSVDG